MWKSLGNEVAISFSLPSIKRRYKADEQSTCLCVCGAFKLKLRQSGCGNASSFCLLAVCKIKMKPFLFFKLKFPLTEDSD